MAEELDLGFDLPPGHVVVQNVSGPLELPFENRRVIPTGGLWHMPVEEIDSHMQAAGHRPWRRYDQKTAAVPVPQDPPVFLTDDPLAEERD